MTKKEMATGVVHKVPADMEKALASDGQILAKWNDLTSIQRNEWICWTTIVKKPKTRAEHIERMVAELKEGERQPCCWPGCPHRRPKAKNGLNNQVQLYKFMQKTITFFMFVGEQCGKAEEAMELYTSLFKNSEIKYIERWKAGEPGGEEGLVKHATFTINGQEYMASENSLEHKFAFTPSISIYVNCESEEEIESLSTKLSEGGGVMMPLDNYGFSKKFGWVADKFGVSWQLNLA